MEEHFGEETRKEESNFEDPDVDLEGKIYLTSVGRGGVY
jgi:hypothetical protein